MFDGLVRLLVALRLIPPRPRDVAVGAAAQCSGASAADTVSTGPVTRPTRPLAPLGRALAQRIHASGRDNRPRPATLRPVPGRAAGMRGAASGSFRRARAHRKLPAVAAQSLRTRAALMNARRRSDAERALARLMALVEAVPAAATGRAA